MGRAVWRHEKGSFKRLPNGRDWQEMNADGTTGSLFRQVHQEGTAIVIRNDEREIELLLRDDVCGIKNKGEQQFQQLYPGGWARIVDCTWCPSVSCFAAVRSVSRVCANGPPGLG